jgi:hypothetical protein
VARQHDQQHAPSSPDIRTERFGKTDERLQAIDETAADAIALELESNVYHSLPRSCDWACERESALVYMKCAAKITIGERLATKAARHEAAELCENWVTTFLRG